MSDDPYPDWGEPATKGDVVRAMIWSKGLTGALFGLVVAVRGGDQDKIVAAIERFADENAEMAAMIDTIGGKDKA